MAKKVTGNKAKATAKAKAKTTNKNGSRKVAKVANPPKGKKTTVTVVKKGTGARVKFQHVAVGSLELQYSDKTFGNVYIFSPKLGVRYQLQEGKDETIVCQFSPTGRKYRYVSTETSLRSAVQKIKAGKLQKFAS